MFRSSKRCAGTPSNLKSVPLTAETLAGYDLVLLATDHDLFEYDLVLAHAKLVVDTRGRYGSLPERGKGLNLERGRSTDSHRPARQRRGRLTRFIGWVGSGCRCFSTMLNACNSSSVLKWASMVQPTHAPAERFDDNRQEKKAGPRRNVGDVGHPQQIGAIDANAVAPDPGQDARPSPVASCYPNVADCRPSHWSAFWRPDGSRTSHA